MQSCAGFFLGVQILDKARLLGTPLGVMKRGSPLGGWAWGVWVLVAIACSSTTTLPPPLPDCTGSKDTKCSVALGGGGGAPGSGGTGDSSTTTEDGETVSASCTNAATQLGASSQACETCIELGPDSGTGAGNCCSAAAACPVNSACAEIVACAVLCGTGNTTCISGCVTPSGAAAFDDFMYCLQQNCSPECPSFIPSVASEQ